MPLASRRCTRWDTMPTNDRGGFAPSRSKGAHVKVDNTRRRVLHKARKGREFPQHARLRVLKSHGNFVGNTQLNDAARNGSCPVAEAHFHVINRRQVRKTGDVRLGPERASGTAGHATTCARPGSAWRTEPHAAHAVGFNPSPYEPDHGGAANVEFFTQAEFEGKRAVAEAPDAGRNPPGPRK